jgi:hypothetical protein
MFQVVPVFIQEGFVVLCDLKGFCQPVEVAFEDRGDKTSAKVAKIALFLYSVGYQFFFEHDDLVLKIKNW